MRSDQLLLQLRLLKLIKEPAMKSKTLFPLILITLLTSLIPAVYAQTFSVIHTFTGKGGDLGAAAGVTKRGNALYGTSGKSVYQLTHSGSNWLYSTIAPIYPYYNLVSRPVFGPDGHLYGNPYSGGPYSFGSVLELTPQVGPCKDAACNWNRASLHDFGSGTDGRSPYFGELIWDKQGNMYGTASGGGTFGWGAVFELTPSGNGYTESVIYSFTGGADGGGPWGGIVFDKNGNLFGIAEGGGSTGNGTVYELTYVPGVGWTEKVIYNFQDTDDGTAAVGTPVFDSAGNLYGATTVGGVNGGGTVFELSPSGSTWTFKVLYSFTGPRGVMCGPYGPLAMDTAGNLYGSTGCEFTNPNGNVFKLTNTANGWVYSSLHNFTGGHDGMFPGTAVSVDTDGTLYGVAGQGGDHGYGTIWMIKP